jgi:hypothetical protein
MSSVSALKVFTLFGKRLSQDSIPSVPRPVMASTETGGAAAAPPGGWDQLMTLLNTMNDGIKTLQSEVTTLNTNLDKNTTEITTFKTDLANFKSEIGGKVELLEQKYEELTEDVEAQLKDFRQEVRVEVADEVEKKLSDWKQSIKQEILDELKSEVGADNITLNPPNMPNTTVGQKFQHLLRLSRSLESNFCMGHSKQKTPSVCTSSVLRQFFPKFDISYGGKSNAALVRFSVHPKQSMSFHAKLQEVRGAIMTYGWWVAQENPADLRAMYTLTNDFLKYAKTNKTELKAFFLTIECGWVYLRDQPIIPVFLVPTDSAEWDVLSGLLLAKLKDSKGIDWLTRVAQAPKPDAAFLGKWLEAMKLRGDLAQALLPLFSSQEDNNVVMVDGQEELRVG